MCSAMLTFLRRQQLDRSLVVMAGMLALSGCPGPISDIQAFNATDRVVVVTLYAPTGGSPYVARVQPNLSNTVAPGDPCLSTQVEVAHPGKDPFADFSGKLCAGDIIRVDSGGITIEGQ